MAVLRGSFFVGASKVHGPFLLLPSPEQEEIHLLGGQKGKRQIAGEELDRAAVDLQNSIAWPDATTPLGRPVPDYRANVNSLLLLMLLLIISPRYAIPTLISRCCWCRLLPADWAIANGEAETSGDRAFAELDAEHLAELVELVVLIAASAAAAAIGTCAAFLLDSCCCSIDGRADVWNGGGGGGAGVAAAGAFGGDGRKCGSHGGEMRAGLPAPWARASAGATTTRRCASAAGGGGMWRSLLLKRECPAESATVVVAAAGAVVACCRPAPK